MTRILSVIIPAWNEGKVIYSNIKRIDETLNQLFEKYGYSYEIILVNDGSIDNTYNEAMRAAKNNKKIKVINYKDNGGKGFALKYGFKFCSGNFVTFIDADLDLHPKQIQLFIEYMKKYDADVVIGSKRHRLSKINYPFSRNVLSVTYNLLIKSLFRLNLSDTQTGIKLFKYKVLYDILPVVLCKKFAFDLELLVNARHKQYKIIEAPIELNWQRLENRMKLEDVWKIILDTAAIFYRLKILKYYDRKIKYNCFWIKTALCNYFHLG